MSNTDSIPSRAATTNLNLQPVRLKLLLGIKSGQFSCFSLLKSEVKPKEVTKCVFICMERATKQR